MKSVPLSGTGEFSFVMYPNNFISSFQFDVLLALVRA